MFYVITCPYSQVNNEYEDGRFRRARAASRRTRGYINLAIITGLITIVIVILAVLQLFEVIDLDSNGNTNGTTTSVDTTGGNGYTMMDTIHIMMMTMMITILITTSIIISKLTAIAIATHTVYLAILCIIIIICIYN